MVKKRKSKAKGKSIKQDRTQERESARARERESEQASSLLINIKLPRESTIKWAKSYWNSLIYVQISQGSALRFSKQLISLPNPSAAACDSHASFIKMNVCCGAGKGGCSRMRG